MNGYTAVDLSVCNIQLRTECDAFLGALHIHTFKAKEQRFNCVLSRAELRDQRPY